ncbi:Rieske 2Fe-2S domain-containing protein [Lentilitoribacter sp. Alg239-R112]|jgi:nitrite reductase/ring-hydroxylating ferredoxin subunit|uniref:Rieske (2Fe-2S) protein n=1 Tax=Lentilitoribacter sp. Alg239-R112 TaxID=2305987 RepID=UPI0013A6BFFF|nr:Rieske 2Fe-2S domain-containing protein [Lentilitoribacter sp. Alg239-R112]
MSDAWKSYPNAPASGTDICNFSDVENQNTLTIDLDGFPLLIVRKNERLHVFVNACPHQYLPLDYKGDKLLSSDGTMLRCTNHSASFDIETGEGVEGLGVGCNLDIVPVRVINNRIVIEE